MSHLNQEQIDIQTATRLRRAVDAESVARVEDEGAVGFAVTGENGTQVIVGVRDGVTHVVRTLASGRITANAQFAHFPFDMVSAAVVAMVKEA